MPTKKIGRPTDSPKDTMFRVRINKETERKLAMIAEKLKTSKSDVVRKGIDLIYDTLNEN